MDKQRDQITADQPDPPREEPTSLMLLRQLVERLEWREGVPGRQVQGDQPPRS